MLYSIVKEKGCLRLFKLSTARKYIWLHVPLEVNIIVIYSVKSLTRRRCLPGSAPSERFLIFRFLKQNLLKCYRQFQICALPH